MDFTSLENLSGAFCEARVLHTAVELDLFSAVAGGATHGQAARARGLNPRATELLLNALTALDLLIKRQGVFEPTPSTRRYLLPDSPEYLGGMIAFEAASWDLWGKLTDAVRTGKPVRTPDMYQNHPEETRRFIMAMDSLVRARGDDRWLAEHVDFSGVHRLLDVGSGPGTYPIAICRAHPGIAATIFDLPGTLAVTREVLAGEGMEERIELVEGDYRSHPLPAGFDVVFLSNIIHGEDEAACAALVAAAFSALNPGGRLIIKDHILNADRTAPAAGAVFSLHMLLVTRGRDYSLDEVAAWIAAAGFEPPAQTDLPPPFSSSLVVARKPR